MKLHLPKQLFTALLAVFTLTTVPVAKGISVTETTMTTTISGDTLTKDGYIGSLFNYTVDETTGIGTFTGIDTSYFQLTFTLDYDKAVAAGQTTNTSGTVVGEGLVYVTSSIANWGLQLYDSDGTESNASTVITGRWQGAKWDSTTVALDPLTEGGLTYTATIAKTGHSDQGVKLYEGTTTDTDTKVYDVSALRNDKDIISATVNTSVLTEVLIQDKCYTISNADGTFEKTLDGAAYLTSSSGGKHEVVNSSAVLDKKSIIVGNNTQLFLQTWGSGAGAITNESDIYIGKTSYTETNNEGEVLNTGVAIRFGNDGSTTTLGGNIYLVEDAKIKSGGTYTITINGTITDVIDGVDTGSVLTIEGQGYQIAGTMQVSGLELVGGSSRMDFLGGSTLQVEQTIQNAGTISLEGGVVFDSINFDNYEALGLKYSSSTSSKTSVQSGYRYADQIVLISGTVINNATSITGDQTFTAEVQDGIGLVGTFSETVMERTSFYVNENAVWDSTGFEDNTATHYVVAADCTFDVNWDNDSGDDMNGKNIVLKDNATLVNGSAFNSGAYAANIGWQQLSSITLQGNASVGGNKQFGLLGGNYSATTLTLNGHTLTKQGSNTFLLINTTVDAGVIDIQEGDIQVGYNQGTKLTDASKATVNLSGGSLTIYSGDTFKIAGLTGDNTSSKIKGSGNIQLVGSGTYESQAELSGSVKLIVDNTGGSQTLRVGKDWTATSGAINLKAGSLTLILDADATLNKTSITTGAASLLLGGSGTYNLGSHTANSAPALNLTLDTSWEGTVTLSGGNRGISLTGLSGFSNPNSKLKLTGFKGYLSGTDTKMSNNLILENTTQNIGGVDKAYALRLDNGSSEEDTVITFTGTIEGDGNIVYAWKNDGDKQPTRTATHVFSNSTEDWNGMFIRDLSLSESGRVYGKYVTAKFTAGGDVFGANGTGGVKDAEASGKLTVEIAAGNNSTNFRGTIEDVGNVVVNSDTTFQKKVTTEELTIAAGKTTTINDTLKAGNVSNNGTLKLGNAATITSKEGSAAMTKVQMSSAGISTTATDGSKGSIRDALIQLAQDASFTIQDMALTNTTITAATAETRVNLNNVSASNLALATGKFTMNAAPVVGLGGTEATFNTGVSSLTAGAATLTLDLDMIGAYESTGAVSGATLTITLGVSGANFSSYTVENWQALVGFDQESWLGQALVDATFTTEAVAASAEAGSAAPTVSYGYAAGGSNVGMLTITITGLNVPEPATATLSLLALAALAARRRRKA